MKFPSANGLSNREVMGQPLEPVAFPVLIAILLNGQIAARIEQKSQPTWLF